MTKRKRGFTQKEYEKWLNEGRGQGSFEDYKPWLRIQDVPSEGLVTRLHGNKIERQYWKQMSIYNKLIIKIINS